MSFKRLLAACLAAAALPCAVLASAGDAKSGLQAPTIASKSGILIDALSGEVLFEKDADRPIPPASLSKLITMCVVLDAVDAGKVSLDDIVDLPRQTWAVSQPWGSSLMFLGPGQRVTLREVMLGMAVASGNDAAVAAALHVGGSIPEFVSRMNALAKEFGLEKTRFVEPAGISEKNITTARDFVRFCQAYLSRHPKALEDFHSVKEFSYPKAENLPEAFKNRPRTIEQTNRNLLLGEIPGVDGLKTGYIIESGYNIALTGKRGDTRFIAVLLGGPGANSSHGGRVRAEDAGKVLEWGFDNYRTVAPEVKRLAPARVWKGKSKEVAIEPLGTTAFTVRSDRGSNVSCAVLRSPEITAPIAKGAKLGELVFSDDRGELKRIPLVAASNVARGGWFSRAADSVSLFFLKLFGNTV